MQSKALQEVNNESWCLMCQFTVCYSCVAVSRSMQYWLRLQLFRSTLEGCLWFMFSNNFRWPINITSGKQLNVTVKDSGWERTEACLFCVPVLSQVLRCWIYTTPHYILIGWTVGVQWVIIYFSVCKNSLHKTCMMYRIVYTKLSFSLLVSLNVV